MSIEKVRELGRTTQQRAVDDAFLRYSKEYEQVDPAELSAKLDYLRNVANARERAITNLLRKGQVMDAQSSLFEAARAHAELRAAEQSLESRGFVQK